jgi:chaperone protein DnaJ
MSSSANGTGKQSKKSFYEILGIQKEADEEAIRKAYKKLALKWHPDRNRDNQEEANNKFQEINKAYNVLSDTRKRQIYDQHGEDGLEGVDAPGGAGFDPSDIFSRFFGGGGPGGGGFSFFGGGGGDRENKAHQASPQKEVAIAVDITTSYKGGKQDINVQHAEKCPDCDGRGCKSADDIIKCPPCNGQGITIQVQRTPFGVQQMHSTCRKCQGRGKSIKSGTECQKCQGRKSVQVAKKYTVDIPAGAIDGFPITIKGESDWVPDYGFVGDLVLVVRVTTPAGCIFKREGHNLVIKKQVSLVESLCGLHFGVRHLDDRILEIRWDRIVKPGDSLVVKGEGLPVFQPAPNSPPRGDMILRFEVIYPGEYLDQQTKQAIRTAIPNSQTPPGQAKSMNINMSALYEQIRMNPALKETVKIIEPELAPEQVFSNSSGTASSAGGPDFEPAGFTFMPGGGIPGGIPGMGIPGGIPGMGIPGGDMPGGVQCAQQ